LLQQLTPREKVDQSLNLNRTTATFRAANLGIFIFICILSNASIHNIVALAAGADVGVYVVDFDSVVIIFRTAMRRLIRPSSTTNSDKTIALTTDDGSSCYTP
jgi:hypothetical protein